MSDCCAKESALSDELIRPVRAGPRLSRCLVCQRPEPGSGQTCAGCGGFVHTACGSTCPECAPTDPEPAVETTQSVFSTLRRRGLRRESVRLRVRVTARSEAPGRCAYCHDDPQHFGYACSRCGVWLHGDCWREVQTCPSQGCGATPARYQIPDAALEAWAASVGAPPAREAQALRSRLIRRRRLWGALALVGAVATASLIPALLDAESASSAYLLTFGLALLLQLLVWPALAWDRWRATCHDVDQVLGAPPVACRLWIQRSREDPEGVRVAKLKPLDPTLSYLTLRVRLDPALVAPWLDDLALQREPVLLYGFGDRHPPYAIRTLDDRLTLVWV